MRTGTVWQDEFSRRLLGIAMLVRLISILMAFVGLVGEPLTATVLACSLAMSGASLALLLSPAVASFVARHPFVCVTDVLLSLAVVALVGVESPLVIATMSSALVVGFLFRPVIASACGIVLVAGYLLAAVVGDFGELGFMTAMGVPTLYVGLIVVGGAVRHAHDAQAEAVRLVAEARFASASADERARLAREMHDSLGKTLHGISLGAEALPRILARDPGAATYYATALADGAERAAQEARQILVRLRADQPDRPLVEVLRERCAAWEQETGVTCTFTVDGFVDISTDARYELLAIVEEALENARRHAEANRLVVRLVGRDGRVGVEVEDDGRGFVPAPDGTSPPRHYGLTGMAERARVAGLELTIRSAPARGTTVSVGLAAAGGGATAAADGYPGPLPTPLAPQGAGAKVASAGARG